MTKPRYTHDLLTRAAAKATSMVDLMHMLGAPMGSGPRCYLSKRLQHYGIDTSHFREVPLAERERRSYPEELLREAAAHSNSIREMLEYMGLPPRDGPYGHIIAAAAPRTANQQPRSWCGSLPDVPAPRRFYSGTPLTTSAYRMSAMNAASGTHGKADD
jgi:hypothetical protein